MGLHRVENASHSSPAVSLHLYSPPFSTCRTFDQRTGMARTVRVMFWSEHGRRTTSVDSCSATASQQRRPVSQRRATKPNRKNRTNDEARIFFIFRPLYFHPVVSSIFLLCFFLFSSPNFSRRKLDAYHTSTYGVPLVRI